MSLLTLGLAVATSIWNGGDVEAVTCPRPVDARCHRHVRAARRQARGLRAWKRHRRRAVRPYLGWLSSTRWCESHGNYRIATGNGYWGAYQFTLGTWHSIGGQGYPHANPPLEQDYRAVLLLNRSGSGQWPVCG